MKLLLTPAFKRAAKKLHRNQIVTLEANIAKIQKNPMLGELKIGDLAGVRVHKFYVLKLLLLLAYLYDKSTDQLILLSLSPHENFYQNLKKQLNG